MNGSSPFSTRDKLSLLNPEIGITISPLASNSPLKSPLSFNGTVGIVFTLFVTSSPFTPSPLVTALTSSASLYVKLIETPSNFNSHVYSKGLSIIFFILFSHSFKSSREYELSREYIGVLCSDVINNLVTLPPTL